jgi:hypothetical protein
MIHRRKTFLFPLTLLVLALACSPLLAASHEEHQHKSHQHEGHQHPMKAEAATEAGEAPVFAATPAPRLRPPPGLAGRCFFVQWWRSPIIAGRTVPIVACGGATAH